ncbi:peptidase MA family metallohydrolase [Neomoorella humiferrea]|uniref:Peptidase MA-like domain-containing protein n=1 Tax=Neomoorella humiferrea TaxID=676965 RepID=A0A2T0AL07_9FIRM|nr:peptidase MA family metallohydrolase [Moorella humiferrea]PRR69290.1 hypothetical protein MOHU_23870 [Moorella humiferrea]
MSSRWWSGIAAGFFALIVAGANLVRAPVWLRTSSYGAVRWVAEAHAAWQTRQWPEIESPHFRLRYREQDATVAPIVLAAAEEAYAPVEEMLGNAPRRQTLIILYPDRRSLALQFGWPASESAMGVYWGGVIRVLSPLDWISAEDLQDIARIFTTSGPMAHELAHLLVDERARGNYPRWLTEGLAQYVEKKITGFTMPGSLTAREWYSLRSMDYGYDGLPDQALAYRQSLLMTEYMVDGWGLATVHRLLDELGKGITLEKAFQEILGMDLEAFAAAFTREYPVEKYARSH